MATTGQVNAVSASQYGDDILIWTNPGNAAGASATSFASIGTDPEAAPDPGNTLTLLFQPTFPGNADAPTGYVVRTRRRQTGGGGPIYTNNLQLSLNPTTTGGANKADTTTDWTTAAGYEIIAYGADGDVWGNTFTLAQLTTGVYVHLRTVGDSDPFGLGTVGRVEHVSLEVFYSETAATGGSTTNRTRRSIIAFATHGDTESELSAKHMTGRQ